MTAVQARCERASAEAKQSLTKRIAKLGAVPLRSAAAARGIDPDSAGVWAKRGLSTSAFRGPRGVWCVREPGFDAELEAWRCSWDDGCERYALLSSTGRCHEHAGRPKPDGRLTAEEFAAKHGLNLGYLLERLVAGEIPAERVNRQGRTVQRDHFHATWRITEQDALEALDEHFQCKTDGCDTYALAPSSYCAACTTTRMQSARWPESPGKIRKICPECGRERIVYPSLQRAGDLCGHCSIVGEDRETTAALLGAGLVPIKQATSLLYRSPTGLRSVVSPERLDVGGRRRSRLGVNARAVLRLSPHPDARRKLSKPLAVLNGTERFGRVSVLTDAEQELVVRLRVADPGAWSWRKLADKLNEKRAERGEKSVSFMAVKRAFERATRPHIAL